VGVPAGSATVVTIVVGSQGISAGRAKIIMGVDCQLTIKFGVCSSQKRLLQAPKISMIVEQRSLCVS